MLEIKVYNFEKKPQSVISLPKELFGQERNDELLHLAFISQFAEKRKPLAHTKTRGEVRGGGKKPWRQKGTGRARAGSIRSPLWRGGGVVFGPRKEKVFVKRLNKRAKVKAILVALSSKFQDKEIIIVANFKKTWKKTKEFFADFQKLPLGKTNLIIPEEKNKEIFRLARNLKNVKVLGPRSLNIYDLLTYKKVILSKEALPVIEKHFKLVK